MSEENGVTETVADPAGEYIAGVRAALSDLPASEVAEILDDVQSHLADLAAELGAGAGTTAFTDRLGTPEAYAAELRAAAGYPPAPPVEPKVHRPGPVAAGLAVAGLVIGTACAVFVALSLSLFLVPFGLAAAAIGLVLIARDGPRIPSVAALPVVRDLRAARPAPGQPIRGVIDFVASLQPAWWVLRALIAAFLLEEILLGGRRWFLVVLLGIAGILVSIWLARQSRRDRRWVWLVVPLNGLAVGLLLLAVARPAIASIAYEPSSPYSIPPARSGLWQGDDEVRDIRPVDASGNPLTGIYLFDQDGRPIAVEPECTDYSRLVPSTETLSPNGPPRAMVHPQLPYPQGVTRYGPNGKCVTIPPGPLVVAVPKPTEGPSLTPTPTAAAQPTGANPPANVPPPVVPLVTTKPGAPG